jgi:hypothetical protein
MQTAGADVSQSLLEHLQSVGIRENLDRFQDRLKQISVNDCKCPLVVPRDPNHSIFTQPLVQCRELAAGFRNVESGRSHNSSVLSDFVLISVA